MLAKIPLLSIALVSLIALQARAEDGAALERMPNGKPDLSGTYDAGTVTPADRPPQYGNNLYLSPEEAKKLEETSKEFWQAADRKSEGERQAPPVGGDGNNMFGGGGVGGYNAFWIDPGSEAVMVDGKFRTFVTSGSRIRPRGPRLGRGSTSGRPRTAASTSTPATKATTRWATS